MLHRILAAVGLAAALAAPAFGDDPVVDFSRDVLPILSENCLVCHGPDAAARKADLRLDVRESALRAKDPIIEPGDAEESELILRLVTDDEEDKMPPAKSGKTLTPEQIETLSQWIDQGATWGKHWAFETPRRSDPPEVRDESRVRDPIDRFILARLEREGLEPAPEADKTTLIRRAALDLTGVPPTIEEVGAFLADDRPDAYERLVDRLLASPLYGQAMASDWLDAARYADTNGYQNDFARSMWPWRDWVVSAFNRNMPYDRFVVEQIAGDKLPGATWEQKVATGFNRNNRAVTEAGSIDEEYRIENAVDRVETTATVFLGLTMGCARCHDHKYDPITQREFYEFLGFFNDVNEKGVYTETRGNVPPLIALPSDAQRDRLAAIDAAIADAEKAAPEGDQLAALKKEKTDFEQAIPTVMVMEDAPERRPLHLLKRGLYDQPDASVSLTAGVPACLPPLPSGAAPDRLALARWLVALENPLTARVAVNRLWQRHFGEGLVKSAENFGLQGEPPTHPELLDRLATEFVRGGWDVKALQRRIVTSATYRQSSRASADLIARDPENRLLARGPRHRLDSEALRDNALAIAGLLSPHFGGPSIKPYQPEGLWEELAGGAGEGPYVQDKGEKLYRRSLYVYRKRTVPHPVMATFDAPSREICLVKRARTNTPLQALELLNDVACVEAARNLAARMIAEGGPTAEGRVVRGFKLATARDPNPDERRVLLAGLSSYLDTFRADPDAASALVRLGESPTPEGIDPAELAAYSATAAVILNLDETITRE